MQNIVTNIFTLTIVLILKISLESNDIIEFVTDNNEFLKIRDEFGNFEKLKIKIKEFETKSKCCLSIVNSTTINSAKKRREKILNIDLVYY